MLLQFLNADFSTFDKAYKTFFYAYGFELLKEYVPYKELETTYSSEKKMLQAMKMTYENSYGELLEIQHNFKKCVDQIYNLHGEEELKDCSANSKFIANIITHKSDIYRYSNKIEVFIDNYAQKDNNYSSETYESLAQKLEDNKISIKKHHIYTSEKLSNILFLILEEVVQAENLPIKECQSCGKYSYQPQDKMKFIVNFQMKRVKLVKKKGQV